MNLVKQIFQIGCVIFLSYEQSSHAYDWQAPVSKVRIFKQAASSTSSHSNLGREKGRAIAQEGTNSPSVSIAIDDGANVSAGAQGASVDVLVGESKAKLDEDTDSVLDPKQGYRIINVKHQLTMNDDEIGKTHKDFYINMGLKEGLKPGVVLSVYRNIPVFNEKGFYRYQDMSIKVGQLKVVDVQDKVAVARLSNLVDVKDRPVVDYTGVLVGDRVELVR